MTYVSIPECLIRSFSSESSQVTFHAALVLVTHVVLALHEVYAAHDAVARWTLEALAEGGRRRRGERGRRSRRRRRKILNTGFLIWVESVDQGKTKACEFDGVGGGVREGG